MSEIQNDIIVVVKGGVCTAECDERDIRVMRLEKKYSETFSTVAPPSALSAALQEAALQHGDVGEGVLTGGRVGHLNGAFCPDSHPRNQSYCSTNKRNWN